MNACGVDAVSVNPETQRNVRLNHQVEDGTTRHVLVDIIQTVREQNVDNTSNRIDGERVNGRRRTIRDSEHECEFD